MLHRSGQEDCAYSIASSPAPEKSTIELHMQCYTNSKTASNVIHYLEQHEYIEVTAPLGLCSLNAENMPKASLVFIGAATGFSQMKSLIEFTFTTGREYPNFFYWGAKQPQGFYMSHLPVQWANEKQIEYHPVISGNQGDGEWEGRFGLLYEAVLEDCDKFCGAHFYIGGSPNMVYATVDALVAEGFSERVMHSDVFEYAPR